MFELSVHLKERQFIKQSAKKWKNFELDINGANQNPKKTSKLFVQITDDLSYARTFYPNRMVRKYLDGVSQVLLQRITKAERSTFSTFLSFWLTTLPLALYKSRRALTISTLIFFSAMAVGVLSSMYEPDFARVILGDYYVNMTESNIEKNDPMAVYKEFNELDGFLEITINNIRVALITFMTGVLYAVGTLLIMIYNGIMVGAFQYFFIERGLFWESFLTIWQHGTLEISAIIIAGGAGITMGKGLIYPKVYSRLQSFKVSGRQGLIVFLGTVPLFIIAGFIEGFLTRATDLSPFIRISVIVVSLFFILYYYSWYPRFVHKNTFQETEIDELENIPAEKRISSSLKSQMIYSSNDLLRATYSFCSSKSGFLWVGIIFSSLLSYLMIQLVDWSYLWKSNYEIITENRYFGFLWLPHTSVLLIGIMCGSTLILSMLSHYLIDERKMRFLNYFSVAKLCLALLFCLLLLSSYAWLAIIPFYVILNQIASNSVAPWVKNPPNSPAIFEYFGGSIGMFSMILGVNAVVLFCLLIFNNLLFSGVLEMFTEDTVLQEKMSFGVVYFIWLLFLFCSHFIISAGNYYVNYSENEKEHAEGLKARIKEFQLKHRLKIG